MPGSSKTNSSKIFIKSFFPGSPDIDFEVLRRDMGCDSERDGLSELRNRDRLREAPQTQLSHPDVRPGEASHCCHLMMCPPPYLSKQLVRLVYLSSKVAS